MKILLRLNLAVGSELYTSLSIDIRIKIENYHCIMPKNLIRAKKEEHIKVQKRSFSKNALEGVRVIDLSWIVAGPQCTRLLTDF